MAASAQTVPVFVDLGLSVKWASCNLGASKPEGLGDYYAWGETSPKKNYSWGTYKFGTYEGGMTMYNEADGQVVLKPEHDAATAILGKGCRIPTRREYKELLDKCKWMRTSVNGVSGYKVVGPNGNSIFFPISGYYINSILTPDYGEYWTSERSTKELHCAHHLSLILHFDAEIHELSTFNRSHGRSVRAVCD